MSQSKSIRSISIALIFFVFSVSLFAQKVSSRKPDYRFNLFNLDLRNNRVETVIQDSYGYMWIGTLGGLHKHDGANLSVYPSNINSPDNKKDWYIIYNLFEDSRQRLWVSTNNGIYKYNRILDEFIHYATYDPVEDPFVERNIVYSIVEDDDNTLWIGNVSGGFYYLDEEEEEFKIYFSEEKDDYLSKAKVSSIAMGKKNTLWILTAEQGLINLNPQTRETVVYLPDANDPTSILPISNGKLTVDHKNRLWITSDNHGVDRLDLNDLEKGFKHYHHDVNDDNSLYNDFVVQVYSAPSGQVWLCNRNGGLHLYNEITDDFYRYIPEGNNPHSLSNLAIQTIYEDKEGRLWVGSHISGIEIYDKFQHKFDSYSHSNIFNSVNNDIVRCFYEDNDSNLWIGTDGGGLNLLDRKQNRFKAFTVDSNKKNTISSNVILSIAKDKNGMFWIGTWGGSINLFDPSTNTFTQPYENLEYVENVYSIFRDSKNRMWVGSWHEGVTLFDEEGNEMFHLTNQADIPSSFGDISAVMIFEDKSQNIWIGTESSGVNRVIEITENDVKFKRYFHDPNDSKSIVSDRITHLSEDSSGNLWIASEEGISKYRPESDDFINYGVESDIVNSNIRSIIEGNKGDIWLGTSKGLTKFDLVKEKFRPFKLDTGGASSHFSRYAVLKSSFGELIFGGENGFVIFDPNNFSENIAPIKTYLTGLKVMNEDQRVNAQNSILEKHISLTDHFELTHEQSVISLKYVGVNFTQSDKVKYAYRMLGFEESWNYVGEQREATYMNLKPGDYVFEVKSCNNDEVWSEQQASVSIKVLPPWWFTWWAKTLFCVVCIGSLLAIYFVRVFTLNRQKEVLKEEVSKRTKKLLIINEELKAYDKMVSHDLKGPIGHIYSLAELLKNDTESILSMDGRKFLDQIIKSSNASRELIDGILTFASADQPGILQEGIDLEKHVKEAVEGHSLTIKVKQADIRIEPLPKLEKAISVKVYQLFYNLIGNALKFQKSDVKPVINIYRDGNCRVVVEDNGIGFDQKYAEEIFKPLRRIRGVGINYEGYGIGLGICKRIADFHGWDIKAYGEKGKGAKFVITF